MESWLREPEDYAWGRKVTDAILAIEAEAAPPAADRLHKYLHGEGVLAVHGGDEDWHRRVCEGWVEAEAARLAALPKTSASDDADATAGED
jgi:hypothetical protein